MLKIWAANIKNVKTKGFFCLKNIGSFHCSTAQFLLVNNCFVGMIERDSRKKIEVSCNNDLWCNISSDQKRL